MMKDKILNGIRNSGKENSPKKLIEAFTQTMLTQHITLNPGKVFKVREGIRVSQRK